MSDAHARPDASADAGTDSDAQSLRYAAGRKRPLSEPLAIALTGLLYAIAALALSVAVGEGNDALASLRASRRIDAYSVKLMLVTLGCAAIGGFSATRELTLEQTVFSAVVVAGLAAAITSVRSSTPRALAIISVSLSFAIGSAAVDSSWPAVLSAVLAALPFLLAALFVPERRASLLSAAVAGLAGASIGITSAFFVLAAACLCALVWRNVDRRSLATLGVAPYIAAFTLFGILLNMSILT